jgi:nucleotide-binding universal stress UspA family protein
MKKILVPTDFSDCASNALDFAVQAAKHLSVDIVLLHSFEIKDNMYTDYMGVNRYFNQSMLDDNHQRLLTIKKAIESAAPVKVTVLIKTDNVKVSIEKAVEEADIGLVIMGATGASGLSEKLWGSSTATFMGVCKVPVLAIPGKYAWKKPEKFLLATNQFDPVDDAYDFIFELADLFMAQVNLVVFTNESEENALSYVETARNIPILEKRLQKRYKEEHLHIDHLHGKTFNETVQQHIKEQETDILVMVTHKRKFLESIFHPSMTKKMSFQTQIPLLAVPEPKQEVVY